MTLKVLAQFQELSWPPAEAGAGAPTQAAALVDVAGKLRGLWSSAERQ